MHFLDVNIDVLRHGVQKEVWSIHGDGKEVWSFHGIEEEVWSLHGRFTGQVHLIGN